MTDTITRFLPERIVEALEMDIPQQKPAETICLYNFEASNIAADSVSSYVFARTTTQIHTIVDRVVPAWVRENVDVIIMSYSGNSPEIDEVYTGAKSKGCRIHCITSGGHLKEICQRDGNVNLILIPEGMTHWDVTGYEIGALVRLYEAMGIEGIQKTVEDAIPSIKEYRDCIWESEQVKKLALQVKGRIPVIYCTGELRAVHKRWKMLINDEIGSLAFSGEYPEFNHNELVSWTDKDSDTSDFIIIVYRIDTGSELLNRILNISTDLLKQHRLKVRIIDVGGGLVERSIRGIIYADAVANYLKEAE
jgi:glucose/mannose-6-phosphate isomerase